MLRYSLVYIALLFGLVGSAYLMISDGLTAALTLAAITVVFGSLLALIADACVTAGEVVDRITDRH